MSVVFSYNWQRDPERLVSWIGLGRKVDDARQESLFLDALDVMPQEHLGDLCIVVGGFMDGLLGRAYRILEDLPALLGDGFDIYYREHDEHSGVRRLIRRYGKLGRNIVLIGHSWGGSSLARDILRHPDCRDLFVEILITLDPVGVRKARFLPQVKRWLNIYLPYGKAKWSRENNVARLGQPWEYVHQASLNREPSLLRHSKAQAMFREFGAAYIELGLMDAKIGPYARQEGGKST